MNNYLIHHGIKNQKWGVRNGPPYPLSRNKNKRINKKKYEGINTEKVANVMEWTIPYLALSTMMLMGYYKFDEHVTLKKIKSEIKNNISKNTTFDQIKMINGKHSPEQDLRKSNPTFGTEKGTMMNCVMSSVAYELRRRGYDVRANTSMHGRYEDSIENYFKIPYKNYREIKKDDADCTLLRRFFSNQPENARGVILGTVGYPNTPITYRHAMTWEIKNGKPIIKDAQANYVYEDFKKSPIFFGDKKEMYVYRLDNTRINENNIMDAIRKG